MRKAFLAPWHSLVGDIWLYSLADAQREHDVDVHLTNLVVTHHHTTVTPRNATKRDNDPKTAPRRVVTLRDARKGRPGRNTGKHGADPPV